MNRERISKDLINVNQEKFAASPGLKRWATVENLKNIAESYQAAGSISELEQKLEEISSETTTVKSKLLQIEKRVKYLQEIVKYANQYQATLPIYQSYKKARNSDAYFQKHESEIILHGGAKRMLEQAGFNVKNMDINKLKAELARLESQKKEHSSTYKMLAKNEKELQKQMQKLQTELPAFVDWDKVRIGIETVIKNLLDSRKEGQQLHSIIEIDNREYFTEDEWNTYELIEEFKNGNVLMFSNNKNLYIEAMREDVFATFVKCQNKRFNIFDEEMAIVTAKAYARGNNAEKNQFVGYFHDMWRGNIMSQDLKTEESLIGFRKLYALLIVQKEGYMKCGKVFAARHTEEFVKHVDDIIGKLEEKLEQMDLM